MIVYVAYWVCAGILFYTFIGYGLLIALLARRKTAPRAAVGAPTPVLYRTARDFTMFFMALFSPTDSAHHGQKETGLVLLLYDGVFMHWAVIKGWCRFRQKQRDALWEKSQRSG